MLKRLDYGIRIVQGNPAKGLEDRDAGCGCFLGFPKQEQLRNGLTHWLSTYAG
jgi:hypothetical protein